MSPSRVSIVALVLLCLATRPASSIAQPSNIEQDLEEAKALYREGRFEETIDKLQGVIGELGQLQDIQTQKLALADAHFFLGLAYLAIRDESSARENFRQVVILDPGRQLDREIFAPKVIALFEEARAEVAASPRAPVLPGEAASETKEPANPEAIPLSLGTRVRVELSGNRGSVTGTFHVIDEQKLTLVGDNQGTFYVPREQITKLEVSQGKKTHLWQGALVGAGLGALIGALEQPGCDANGCYTRGENITYGALGVGLIGTVVGLLYKTDQWREFPIERVQIHATFGNKGVGVFASFSF